MTKDQNDGLNVSAVPKPMQDNDCALVHPLFLPSGFCPLSLYLSCFFPLCLFPSLPITPALFLPLTWPSFLSIYLPLSPPSLFLFLFPCLLLACHVFEKKLWLIKKCCTGPMQVIPLIMPFQEFSSVHLLNYFPACQSHRLARLFIVPRPL